MFGIDKGWIILAALFCGAIASFTVCIWALSH